jgi:hypothetical protein
MLCSVAVEFQHLEDLVASIFRMRGQICRPGVQEVKMGGGGVEASQWPQVSRYR